MKCEKKEQDVLPTVEPGTVKIGIVRFMVNIIYPTKVGWLRLMACVYGNKEEFMAAYNYGKTGADNTNQSVFFAWVEGTLPVGQSASYFERLAAKRHKKKTI